MLSDSRLTKNQWSPGLLLCFGALAIVLCWLIITHSFAAYLGRPSPELALQLNRREATALFTLVDREINPVTKPETPQKPGPSAVKVVELREKTAAAILAAPLGARNYRLLGQIAELEGSEKLATSAMVAAVRHSLHEGFAAYWLLAKGVKNRNFPAAAYYADVLLRSGTANPDRVLPALALMLESGGAAEQEVLKLLKQNPPWRVVFFRSIYGHLSDASAPLKLFIDLREAKSPASIKELNAYQMFLVSNKFYELAYYVWLQFLSPQELESAGFLFNGGFESSPSGSPFDWQVPTESNVTIEFAPRSDNSAQRALLLGFSSGRAQFPGVSQLTMLTPGRYKLKGSYKSDLNGPRGVLWTVLCENSQTAGESQRFVGVSQDWSEFEFTFNVPEKGCVAQALVLKLAARSPSEEILSGEIWFDELSVTPN